MANIKARKSKDGRITSYQIRVFRGLDAYGKQIMVTETYKVDPSLTEKQNKDKATAIANRLEEQCKQGFDPENNLTFKQYAERFIEQKTKRTNKALYACRLPPCASPHKRWHRTYPAC